MADSEKVFEVTDQNFGDEIESGLTIVECAADLTGEEPMSLEDSDKAYRLLPILLFEPPIEGIVEILFFCCYAFEVMLEVRGIEVWI